MHAVGGMGEEEPRELRAWKGVMDLEELREDTA